MLTSWKLAQLPSPTQSVKVVFPAFLKCPLYQCYFMSCVFFLIIDYNRGVCFLLISWYCLKILVVCNQVIPMFWAFSIFCILPQVMLCLSLLLGSSG